MHPVPPRVGKDGAMRSAPVALAIAAILALSLTGCAADSGTPGSTATPIPSNSAQPDPVPSGPSTEPEPTPDSSSAPEPVPATPVSIGCNDLVNLQAVYDYNPNYGNQPKFTPPAGSNAARVAASKGTVCNWVQQTSGETFIMAVAKPAPAELEKLRTAAANGTAVSGLGDAAYFATGPSGGEAQVFAGKYWVVASSAAFYDAETARPLIKAALSSLGR